MTQFIPLLHRALVKPKQVETKTASGIILTDSLTRKEQAATEEGEILALGDTFGKDFGAGVLPKVGDKIMFAKYAGKFIKDDEGTDLVLLNDDDIICIVKEDSQDD
jgi:chaperonin GroES